MLQLEDILLLVIVVQLKAALLRGQTCLGRLLFAHEGRPARRFRDPDPCQSCFLQKNKKERANVRENKIVLSKNRFDLRHLSAATSFVKEKKLEIGEGKCLDAAKIRSTNNGHLHGQPSFSNRVLERDQIIQGGEERAERLPDPSALSGQQLKEVQLKRDGEYVSLSNNRWRRNWNTATRNHQRQTRFEEIRGWKRSLDQQRHDTLCLPVFFLSFFLSPRGDFFLLFRGDARSIKLLARIFQQEIYRAQSHSNAANTRRRSQALNASTLISPTIMSRPLDFSLLSHRAKTNLVQTSRFKRTRKNSSTLFRKNR